MLIELYIMLEIIAFVFAAKAYSGFTSINKEKKSSLFWALAAVVFAICAIAGFNIQVALNDSITNVVQTPIAMFNMGLGGLSILFFFLDTFDKGF